MPSTLNAQSKSCLRCYRSLRARWRIHPSGSSLALNSRCLSLLTFKPESSGEVEELSSMGQTLKSCKCGCGRLIEPYVKYKDRKPKQFASRECYNLWKSENRNQECPIGHPLYFNKSGRAKCPQCSIARRFERLYGIPRAITLAFRPRPPKCEVCGRKATTYLDHCHRTNKLRGWLCVQCNSVLGYVDDSPVVLRRLALYLEKHK